MRKWQSGCVHVCETKNQTAGPHVIPDLHDLCVH